MNIFGLKYFRAECFLYIYYLSKQDTKVSIFQICVNFATLCGYNVVESSLHKYSVFYNARPSKLFTIL